MPSSASRLLALDRRGSSGGARLEAEQRLERAFASRAGHLLVTGADRRDVADLLSRVLARVDCYASIRVHAAGGSSSTGIDALLALVDSGPSHLSPALRRVAQLRELATRAKQSRQSVFIVVEDGDEATVEQLERLRATLEVVPEAIETLRLVLTGGEALRDKVGMRGARALSSRITARIRVESEDDAPSTSPWTLPAAVALSLLLLAYGGLRVLTGPPASDSRVAAGAPIKDSARSRSIVGNEAFLRVALGIPIEPAWITGSALYPAPHPYVEEPNPLPVVVASAPEPPPLRVTRPPLGPARAHERPESPVPAPAEDSSIAALMRRFR